MRSEDLTAVKISMVIFWLYQNSALKIEAVCSSEMLVPAYKFTASQPRTTTSSSIKYSRAHSLVNWLQVETDVSGNLSPHHQGCDDGDRDSSRHGGFYLQPIDAAMCPRIFY
jgi:hypothetical protein